MKSLYTFLLLSVIPIQNSLACELSEDYIKIRSDYSEVATREYRSCKDSVNEANKWFKFSKCREKPRVSHCEEGVLMKNSKVPDIVKSAQHCELFKPNQESLSLIVKSLKIQKCKT